MMKPGNPKYRYLYAVWAFLECLGFGGLIYGWGSLVFVLKDEGLYLDLCHDGNDTETEAALANVIARNVSGNESFSDSSSTTCDERESRLNLVFTIGSSMFCVGSFVMGQINFKFGTRMTRLFAFALFIIGALLIAFTSNDVPWLIFPGLCCLAIGGITYLMTNMQISALFPVKGSALVGLICGGFDASSGIQLLMKMGHQNGITRQTSYIIIACAHILTLISTFLFLPKDFIKKPPPKYMPGDNVAVDAEHADVELINGNYDKDNNRKAKNEEDEKKEVLPPLKKSLFSPFYYLHVFWLCILQLRFYFFLGTLNPLLEKMYTTKDEVTLEETIDMDSVSQSTDVFMYILMCGLLASPFAGFVYDGQKRIFQNAESQLSRTLMPSVIPLAITTVICLLFSGLMLVENPNVLYATYVLVLFYRSFMYTMAAGFLSSFFPIGHFGILYGIMLLCGGIVAIFQYGFFSWAKDSGHFQVNVVLLLLMATSFIHPFYIWRQCRKEKKSASFRLANPNENGKRHE